MKQGRVHQISISSGGVPKRPVAGARISVAGLDGDWQDDRKHHGGPDRAVCLYSLEVIGLLHREGHPIAPGTAGENLTLSGLEWSTVVPGCRLRFEGGVELEVVSYTSPCATIRGSFLESNFRRIKQDLHPGQSRVYARVLCDGEIRTGATVQVLAPHGPDAPEPRLP